MSITTARLLVRDGVQILAATFGEGNAGNLTINASESVEVIQGSGLRATVGEDATGDGGDVTIDTPRLVVSGRSLVSATTSAIGDGGDLTINTAHLVARDVAFISTVSLGQGNAGNLTINASESVEVHGGSGLLSGVGLEATGDGGDLSITTARLLVRDGAQINASTVGEGNAGNLTINASESVEAIGQRSFLAASVNSGARGDGGDLSINTSRLLVRDGAQILASTFGEGNAGNLTINASESVEAIGQGSILAASVEPGARGNGGDLSITTARLLVRDGAEIRAATFGEGNAGNLTINASESVEVSEGDLGGFSPTRS
ncbi:MAG: hypothetical protein HC925_02980 [Coleofasciculaceae cyanobacterium SM2_3_26]|nr:hypothetical protein [Coleofasciculaceae cyanobacterium SM2_3_26]